jgi:hypothetical protein
LSNKHIRIVSHANFESSAAAGQIFGTNTVDVDFNIASDFENRGDTRTGVHIATFGATATKSLGIGD